MPPTLIHVVLIGITTELIRRTVCASRTILHTDAEVGVVLRNATNNTAVAALRTFAVFFTNERAVTTNELTHIFFNTEAVQSSRTIGDLGTGISRPTRPTSDFDEALAVVVCIAVSTHKIRTTLTVFGTVRLADTDIIADLIEQTAGEACRTGIIHVATEGTIPLLTNTETNSTTTIRIRRTCSAWIWRLWEANVAAGSVVLASIPFATIGFISTAGKASVGITNVYTNAALSALGVGRTPQTRTITTRELLGGNTSAITICIRCTGSACVINTSTSIGVVRRRGARITRVRVIRRGARVVGVVRCGVVGRRIIRRRVVRRRVVRRHVVGGRTTTDTHATLRGGHARFSRSTVAVATTGVIATLGDRDAAVAVGHIGGNLELAVFASSRSWIVVTTTSGGHRNGNEQQTSCCAELLEHLWVPPTVLYHPRAYFSRGPFKANLTKPSSQSKDSGELCLVIPTKAPSSCCENVTPWRTVKNPLWGMLPTKGYIGVQRDANRQ